MPADAGRGPNSTPSSNEGDQQQMSGIAGPQLHPLIVAFGEEGGGKAVLDVLVRVAVAALTAWPGERTLQVCILLHYVISFYQCLVLACFENVKPLFSNFNLTSSGSSKLSICLSFQELAGFQLLPSLVRRRNICVHLVTLVSFIHPTLFFSSLDEYISCFIDIFYLFC
jgi:hypothetical protein